MVRVGLVALLATALLSAGAGAGQPAGTAADVPVLNGKFKPRTDSLVLAARDLGGSPRIRFLIDKDIRFNKRGIGTCVADDIARATTRRARRKCRDALIGRGLLAFDPAGESGRASVQGAASSVDEAVSIFREGGPRLLIHAYNPDYGAFVFLGYLIHNAQGRRFGTTVDFRLPDLGEILKYKVELSHPFDKRKLVRMRECIDRWLHFRLVLDYEATMRRFVQNKSRCRD